MTLKLALVGCGMITAQNHVPAILKSPKVDLAALIDQNLETAAEVNRKYGLSCQVSPDVESQLNNADGFIIATPNHTHFPIAKTILEAGKPVLIEKPVTTTYKDAQALNSIAKENNTFVSVGYKTRHHPNVILLKQLIETNHFGKPISFDYEFGTRGGWAPKSGYNMDKSKAGGGVLVVSGTHFLDRMLYWFGKPTSIEYFDDSFGGVEANCDIYLDFNGGALKGHIRLSKSMLLNNRATIETEQAICVVPETATEHITVFPKNNADLVYELGSRTLSHKEGRDYFQTQIEVFASNIQHKGTIPVDGEFAADSIALIEQMYNQRKQLPEPWSYQTALEGSNNATN